MGLLLFLPVFASPFLGLAPQYSLETPFPTPSSVEKQSLELRGSGKRDGYILTNLLAFWVL